MKVLVADKFEASGLDGLQALGCEVVYEPDAQGRRAGRGGRAGPARRAGRALDPGARRRCSTPGRWRSSCAPAPASTPSTSPAASRARHLRVELSGQERGRRRRADLRPDAGARSPDSRQRRRAARRDLEQEGVLEGARAVRPHAGPARLRQHRPGSGASAPGRSACRSSSGAGASPPTPTSARGSSADARHRPWRRRPRRWCAPPTSSASTWRWPRRRAASSTPRCCRTLRPGAFFDQHRPRPRWSTRRRSPPRSARRACASGSTCSPPSRRRPTGAFADPTSCRCPTSTARTTSAPRPIRRRRPSPPRPCASSARSRRPAGCPTSSTWPGRRRRRTCWWCATATVPACWPTSSSELRAANLNVQETENIIFEGAQAAVARINLDGAPAGGTLGRRCVPHADVLDLQLVSPGHLGP